MIDEARAQALYAAGRDLHVWLRDEGIPWDDAYRLGEAGYAESALWRRFEDALLAIGPLPPGHPDDVEYGRVDEQGRLVPRELRSPTSRPGSG